MDAPSAQTIIDNSQADFASLNYDEQGVERLKLIAVSSLRKITGLALTDVALEDEPLVEHVIIGLTEHLAYMAQPDMLETLADWALIQAFTAGSYSETRRSADDMLKARMLHPVPWISTALWGLMTPDQYDWWTNFFSSTHAPAMAVQEVDWGFNGGFGVSSSGHPYDYSPTYAYGPMWGSDV